MWSGRAAMAKTKTDISGRQAKYYADRLEKHGIDIEAVASRHQAYKDLRYEKIAAVFSRDQAFSVHDVGFGLGHFYEFVKARYPEKTIDYSGSEVTAQFVDHCRNAHPRGKFYLRDLAEAPFAECYDYLVFSGTFYHLAGSSAAEFNRFMRRMVSNGFACAARGIAFNLITGHVDHKTADLFYAEPAEVVAFVARKLSRFFTIDHAVPLYEYTVCVYHESYIAHAYKGEVFKKYFKTGRLR
jgi:hypothetical protein